MTKQERAAEELQAIAVLVQGFGDRYGYRFVSISFQEGTVSAWTPHDEPDPIDLYIWKGEKSHV